MCEAAARAAGRRDIVRRRKKGETPVAEGMLGCLHRPLAFEVRLLVALEHCFRAFPPAEFTQHLRGPVFMVGGQLAP